MEDLSWKARQATELDLLQNIYPNQLHYHSQRQELIYNATAASGATLSLRLPDEYPEKGTPILLSACGSDKVDLRDETRKAIDDLNIPEGEEMLDAIIQTFEEVVARHVSSESASRGTDWSKVNVENNKAVIIWLHHLLNTNKRKLALTPTSRAGDIVGVTKPGYPGVLVYSGKAGAIDEHVAELKAQRWQAFQVRFEETMDDPWLFNFGQGIREVESMAEITEAMVDDTVREAFLRAMKVK